MCHFAFLHPVQGEVHIRTGSGRESEVEPTHHRMHRLGTTDLAGSIDRVEHTRMSAPGQDDKAFPLDVDDESLLVRDLVKAVASIGANLVEPRSVWRRRFDRAFERHRPRDVAGREHTAAQVQRAAAQHRAPTMALDIVQRERLVVIRRRPAISHDRVAGKEGICVGGDRDGSIECVEEGIESAVVVGVTMADHNVFDAGRVNAQRSKVVHQNGSRQPHVEQCRRRMAPVSRRDEDADSVFRLRWDSSLIEMVDEACAYAVPPVTEVEVGEKHVDPVLDEDSDLDAVSLECAHQKIASGLIGEPTAPVIGRGGAVKKKS